MPYTVVRVSVKNPPYTMGRLLKIGKNYAYLQGTNVLAGSIELFSKKYCELKLVYVRLFALPSI
jgi:hypothetical protein